MPIYGPDGGPQMQVKVEPSDFHDAAQKFVSAMNTIYQVLPTLFKVLDGFRGPAGVDDSAKQLDAAYQPAVNAVVTGVNRAVNLLGDIGLGIDISASNHWNADAAANPSGGQPLPWTPVDTGLYLPQRVAVPSLVGSPMLVLPPPLSDKIPMGHVDDLPTVAQAFRGARDTVNNTSSDLRNALAFLFSNNQSQDLNALNDFWNKVGGSSDTAILTALANTCDQIAQAVEDYADWTTDTQNQIIDAVVHFIEDVLLGVAIGLLLGVISDGIGAVAGVLNAANKIGKGGVLVAEISGVVVAANVRLAGIGAAFGGVVGAMTTAINSTPDPNIASAETQSVTDAQEQTEAEQLTNQAAKPGLSADQDAQDIAEHAMKRWKEPNGKDHFVSGVEQTEQGLSRYVNEVLFGEIRTEAKYGLEGGRTAYWDDARKAVIIEGPKGGTVFTPSEGKEFFDTLK